MILQNDGGTMNFAGAGGALSIQALSGTGGTIALGNNVLTLGSDAAARTYSGTFTSSTTGGITYNNTSGGSLALSGNNVDYHGTTTLTAGTVVAANDAALGTGALTMAGGTLQAGGAGARTIANATTLTAGSAINGVTTNDLTLTNTINLNANTLTVNGAGNVTLSGVISGTGGLTLNSTGTLNLGGANTYTGANTVTAGNLNISGSINGTIINNGTMTVNGTVTGNVINNARALLMGTGRITGDLTNKGTVNPGNSPTPGTLTVGTYTVNAGATQVVEIGSASSYGKLVATAAGAGAVTLNGGTPSPRLLGGYLPSTNQVFSNIIQTTGAGGTVAGTFASIDNSRVGNSRTLFWQALYGANNVDLQAVGNYTPGGLNLTSSQTTVGTMLNGLAPTASGDLLTVLDAINALTTNEQVAGAFNEILPLKYGSLPSMTFPVTRMQFQYLRDRMAKLRGEAEFGGSEVSTNGGGFMRGFGSGQDTRMLLASANVASDAGNPLIRRGMEQRWGVYLDPLVNWGNLDSTSSQVGYHYTNAGFTAGADYWLLENLLVGLNTGYNNTGTNIGGTGGSINVNSIPFNAYSSFFSKGVYVNGILGYTYNDYYNMQRNIVFGTLNRSAKASTTGNQFQMAAETGYDLKVGNAIINPLVSMYLATLSTGGFTETNAGALSLKVPGQSATSVQTGIGARASVKTKVGNVTLVPQVSAVWQHEYSDNTRGLDARLAQGSSAMSLQTQKSGRDFAVVGVDLSAKFTKSIKGNVGYTAEVGRSNSSNMGVNVGLRFEL